MHPSEATADIFVDLTIRIGVVGAITNEFVSFMKTHSVPSIDLSIRRVLNSIQSKAKRKNLIVTKADKSSSVIIMDRGGYVAKVTQFLECSQVWRDENFNFSAHITKMGTVYSV